MLFHTVQFGVFFAVVYGLYWALPHRLQNRMLLIGSYVFYGAWDWRYLSLLLISTTVDYLCGQGLKRYEGEAVRKRLVTISIVVNLGMLGIFKYYDFFAVNFESLMGTFGLTVHPYILGVALPVGISFYTFQTMSYTLDVYRKKLDPAENFFDFALYVSFFPQLIAGPIERGTRLLPQILAPRTISLDKIYHGVYLFFWGLFLKVFIADNLALVVDPVFAKTTAYDGGNVLLAVYAFSIQIYCDFAGYSFMAIGLGKVMGIELMENFRRPYFSKNISDFWRRWHISLSSWFRDYVFSPFFIYIESHPKLKNIPLTTRHGIAFFVTLMVTEYLLGLWHGAGWNFGFFGIYHGLAIWAYYKVRKRWDRMNFYIQVFLTFHIACGGWLVFRAPTLAQAGEMFNAILFNFQLNPELGLASTATSLIAFSGVLIVVQVLQDWKNDTFVMLKTPILVRSSFFVLLGCLILLFGKFGNRPFIYFQF
jgi:alginate O-acetyltransferase complex protein AlgI